MTLMEAVAALSLLSFITLMLLPLFGIVYSEKKTIHEMRSALYVLEKEALAGEQYETIRNGYWEGLGEYEFASAKKEKGVEMCIRWEGANERKYEKCLFVLPSIARDDAD